VKVPVPTHGSTTRYNQRVHFADGSIGVGLLTVLTRAEVCAELEAANVNPSELDFLVCNCGAYILYASTNGEWVTDEAWEEKVVHRWDKKLVVRWLALMICIVLRSWIHLEAIDDGVHVVIVPNATSSCMHA
jgi:hypothetical protein